MAMEGWFMEENDEDQMLPHHRNPKEFVSPKHLADLGVLYWHLVTTNYENDQELQQIRQARGYNYMLMRLFLGEPVWTQEDHPSRREYVKSLTEKVGMGVPLEAH